MILYMGIPKQNLVEAVGPSFLLPLPVTPNLDYSIFQSLPIVHLNAMVELIQ